MFKNGNIGECITGYSANGMCGDRVCCEAHGVECCCDCDEFTRCNGACGWFEQARKCLLMNMEEDDEE